MQNTIDFVIITTGNNIQLKITINGVYTTITNCDDILDAKKKIKEKLAKHEGYATTTKYE